MALPPLNQRAQKHLTVRVPAIVHHSLRRLAALRGVKVSELVRAKLAPLVDEAQREAGRG